MLIFLSLAKKQTQARAKSSASWTEVASNKGLASIVSVKDTVAYPAVCPALFFRYDPSVNQILSVLSRGVFCKSDSSMSSSYKEFPCMEEGEK